MDLAAGELPDEPGVYRPEEQLSLFRAFARAGNVLQYPAELRAGEVGVDDEARLLPEYVAQPFFLKVVAILRSPAALPDDGVADRLSGVLVPYHGRFALVRDADRGDIRRSRADLSHRLDGDAKLRGPNFIRVMLYPACLRIVLGELLLRNAADLALFVEEDAAVAGGSRVQCHDVLRHSRIAPFRLYWDSFC